MKTPCFYKTTFVLGFGLMSNSAHLKRIFENKETNNDEFDQENQSKKISFEEMQSISVKMDEMPKHPLVFAKSVFRNIDKHINGLLVSFLYKEKKV